MKYLLNNLNVPQLDCLQFSSWTSWTGFTPRPNLRFRCIVDASLKPEPKTGCRFMWTLHPKPQCELWCTWCTICCSLLMQRTIDLTFDHYYNKLNLYHIMYNISQYWRCIVKRNKLQLHDAVAINRHHNLVYLKTSSNTTQMMAHPKCHSKKG